MIQLLFDTAAQTVKLAGPAIIKTGSDVPVTITFSAAPGEVTALSLALGSDATSPEIKAFTDDFTEESATVWTAVLDANDTRLVAFMAAKGTTTLKLEVVAVIDGLRVVTPNLDAPVQKAIITGDPTSEGGPDYYTAAEVDELIANQIPAALVLGETSSTAYRGDRGKTAYDHSQLTTGNPHNVTAEQVGAPPTTRTVDAAGLATGGGSLAADRTITVPIASQAQAEAGEANNVAMTPLRTAQTIAALAETDPLVFYFRSDGNDSPNTGSIASPFLTAANLVASLPAEAGNTRYLSLDLGAGVSLGDIDFGATHHLVLSVRSRAGASIGTITNHGPSVTSVVDGPLAIAGVDTSATTNGEQGGQIKIYGPSPYVFTVGAISADGADGVGVEGGAGGVIVLSGVDATTSISSTGGNASGSAGGNGGSVYYDGPTFGVTPVLTHGTGDPDGVDGVVVRRFGAGTVTNNSTVTLTSVGGDAMLLVPTTGTLSTLAGAEALTNKSVNGVTLAGGAYTLTVPATGTAALRGTANTFTAANTNLQAIGATSTDGWVASNTTAATSGNQKWSPRFHWTGQGWKTDATAGSQSVDCIAELVPIQGTANPTQKLVFSTSVNGGAYSEAMALYRASTAATSSTTGTLVVTGGLGASGNLWTGGILAVPNGTAAAPTLAFPSATGGQTTGFYHAGNNNIGLSTQGTLSLVFYASGPGLNSTQRVYWTTSSDPLGTIDVNINRSGTSELSIGNSSSSNASGSLKLTNLTASGVIKPGSYTVAGLPSAATAGAGAAAFITDALAYTAHTAPTGGGSVKTPVYSDGSVWLMW